MDDNILESLQEQLAAANAKYEQAKEVLAPVQDEEVTLNSAEYQLQQEFKERMAKIQEAKQALFEKKKQLNSDANWAQSSINALQQKIESIKAAEAAKKAAEEAKEHAAKEYAALEARFDQATISAPWREWAKDHQISAGHKIAQDRYVILADPMGLGKTLSSIITTEMAEKSTKHVTPDEPFLGQVEQEFIPEHTVWTEKAVTCAINDDWPFNQSHFAPFMVKTILNDPENYSVSVKYRNRPIVAGEKTFYLPGSYDIKQALLNQGIIEKVEAHYKDVVTNAITRPVGRKILYICPAPLLRNVMEEWQNWAPHRNVTYIGAMSKAERNFALSFLDKLNEYVIIVNYEAWRRDKALLTSLIECKFDTIIIDEAHNIKDMQSQAYKGVETLVQGLKPEYVIPMTGTPILNRPQELFPLLHLVNPAEFTYERDYLFRYCEEYYPKDADGNEASTPRWRFKEGGLEKLLSKISKNILRRTKDMAGIQLPEKSVIYHELDLDTVNYPDQARAREHMKKFATIVMDSGKAIQATVMIALITRLRQIETWPAGIQLRDAVTKQVTLELDVYESQKIDYIIRKEGDEYEGLIPDVVEDERVVVFSQFKAPLHELKARCEAAGLRAVILDGSTSSKLKDEIRHDFDRKITPNRANSKWDVLLANYKAAGVGLNLTNATQLITLDEEWNPGKREQAWDRIHRIGQTENVTINVIRTKDTIDDWLAGIIDQKNAVVGGFEEAVVTIQDLKNAIDSGLI